MKYIITDPCYLASGNEWDELGEPLKWELESAAFPVQWKRATILTIDGTPNGDGSYGNIGVDSGTLCVAAMTDEEAAKEKFGKQYDTEPTKREFERIRSHF